MMVLDTNVVSEWMRPVPSDEVIQWMTRQIPTELYLSTITEAELRFGVELLPAGRRRERLLTAIEITLGEDFAGRILPFDSAAAQAYAVIAASRRAAGMPVKHSDCQIAAIARSRGLSVATRNVRDFEGCGVDVINPWLSG
ncbi:MAG: type II toxin-antitoxin system VapC family toxin [Chloroflexi bacterium]|nr:type II toxin-antitoxin system VapC family toxin [Chloroflexota bacterium]